MTVIRWFFKWFPVVALFIFLMTLFAMNLDQNVQIKYYGLAQPIPVHFWQLVAFSVSLGIIVVALADLFSQMRWQRERRKMVKRDRGYSDEVRGLNTTIQRLEADKQELKKDLKQKTEELAAKTEELASKTEELAQLKSKESDPQAPQQTTESSEA